MHTGYFLRTNACLDPGTEQYGSTLPIWKDRLRHNLALPWNYGSRRGKAIAQIRLGNMAKRKKKEHDFAVTAFRVVREATGQIEPELQETEPESIEGKNPHAVALGRLGGLKGGKARANKLNPEQRTEIAKKAAQARWKKGEVL
jgi:hypothetical protein